MYPEMKFFQKYSDFCFYVEQVINRCNVIVTLIFELIMTLQITTVLTIDIRYLNTCIWQVETYYDEKIDLFEQNNITLKDILSKNLPKKTTRFTIILNVMKIILISLKKTKMNIIIYLKMKMEIIIVFFTTKMTIMKIIITMIMERFMKIIILIVKTVNKVRIMTNIQNIHR